MVKYTRNKCYMFSCVLIILVVLLKNLDIMNRIYIVGDEFGYWANASWMAGKNWSGVAGTNPFYSYGYSLLLLPLFRLNNPQIMYQCAIVINAVLMCISFGLTYSMVRNLIPEMNEKVAVFFSLAAVLYSNNIFSSNTTQCETLLVFLYTLVFWCIVQYSRTQMMKYMIGAVLTSCYMYTVHMRCLGVLVAVGFCAVVACVQKRNFKSFVLVIAGIVLTLFLYDYIKEIILDNVYRDNTLAGTNDYSGQASKVNAILSLQGLVYFINSLAGKIFYLGTSTFFLFYWCIAYLLNRLWVFVKALKKKERIPSEYIVWIFAVLSIGATICIAVIAALKPFRYETIFYGRYSEHLIIPIIIMGMAGICKFKDCINKRLLLVMIIVELLLGFYTYGIIVNSDATTGYFNHIAVLASMVMNQKGEIVYPLFTIVGAIKAIFVITIVLYLISRYKKNTTIFSATMLMLAFVWVHYGIQWTEQKVVSFQKNTTDNVLVDYIEELCEQKGTNEIIYCTFNEESNVVNLYADYIQFLLPDYCVKAVEIASVEEIDSDTFFVINTQSNIVDLLYDQCNIYKSSQNFYVCSIRK